MSDSPKGPRSSEHASGKDELGFDPDSPDVADPQVDPIGPAIAPLDKGKKQPAEKKAALRSVGRLEEVKSAPRWRGVCLCGGTYLGGAQVTSVMPNFSAQGRVVFFTCS